MAVTTQQLEYQKLRSYLNPLFQGPVTTAVLNSLASGCSAYLVNNSAAIFDQLFITSASGVYLDRLLAAYGIVRPSNVGLSDQIFSEIGIQIKNRKQVRNLINNILNIIFGDYFTKATDNSTATEPYALTDGDTLIINFDYAETVTITFRANQFENIAAATAVEIADSITETLVGLQLTGSAISTNSGSGNYVQLISSTIGPASSVTVLGGSAQNQLRFPSIVSAGGDASTQWTVTSQAGGLIRFTWTGGTNPVVGDLTVGNYVNIYGGGFTGYPLIEGSYIITNVVGGAVGTAYFEVKNILANLSSPLIITQGGTTLHPAMLFFDPVTKNLQSLLAYAAVYQTKSGNLQVFLPATTGIVDRTRLGAAFLHDPPTEIFTFIANPNPGDMFSITSIHTLIAGINFVICPTFPETMANMAAAINMIAGLEAIVGNLDFAADRGNIPTVFTESLSATISGAGSNMITFSSPAVNTINVGDILSIYGITGIITKVFSQSGVQVASPGFPVAFNPNFATPGIPATLIHIPSYILTVYQDSTSLTLTGTYTGAAAITGSGPLGDPISLQPNQYGPYIYDTTQPFWVSSVNTTLTQNLDGADPRIFTVANAAQFPDAPGFLVFDYGSEDQEGPVPYVGRPSSTTLLISPEYSIKTPHLIGANVFLAYDGAVTVASDGSDWPFYITDVVAGRVYAQALIESVVAAGILVNFTIEYPSDIGLGKWGTPYSEISVIYGENQ